MNTAIDNSAMNSAKIAANDFSNFMDYCILYNSLPENTPPANPTQDTLLQYYYPAKGQYLYDLLDGNLIISKHVQFETNYYMLSEEIEALRKSHHTFLHELLNVLQVELTDGYLNYKDDECRRFYYSVQDWLNDDKTLTENRVTEKIAATICGTKIVINSGEKILRALRRICETLDNDTSNFDFAVRFERYRLDHSRIFNQRNLSGDLCLSIHPLDYATASDNDNGWSSCMSWQEEGCYRLGTVEMMNSPMVICAYLKSNVQEMSFGSWTWPSKKWRAWIIVTPSGILCNRNYPYDNEQLSRECINWVKELAAERFGWTFTSALPANTYNYPIEYATNFMYNDYRNSMLFAGDPAHPENKYLIINYSGIANCMNCGDRIYFDDDSDSATLLCEKCNNTTHCYNCGCRVNEDVCYGPNEETLCVDCYNEIVTSCDLCGEVVYTEDQQHIHFPMNTRLYSQLTNSWEYYCPNADLHVCPYCANHELNIDSHSFLDRSKARAFSRSADFDTNSWDTNYTLDPRKISLQRYYSILGYSSNSNGELIYSYEAHNAESQHLKELYYSTVEFAEEQFGTIEEGEE